MPVLPEQVLTHASTTNGNDGLRGSSAEAGLAIGDRIRELRKRVPTDCAETFRVDLLAVEDREHADACAEVFGIGRDGDQGLGRKP